MRIDHEQHARSSPEPRFSSRAHGSAPASIAGVKRALVLSRARLVLEEVFGPVNDRRFAVRLWDGSTDMSTVAGTPSFTLVVNSPGALRRMFLPPSELRLAESFVCGDVDIEGDLESATALGDAVRDRLGSPEALTSVALGLLALPGDEGMTHLMRQRELGAERRTSQHSRASDSAAIRSHYDVGNDFYALWLDRAMVYSCAYFETEDDDIEDAQRAKLDLICRKLRLAPDERLLDIGCGWGALVRHAVTHYGVSALGVTLSPAQAMLANDRIYDEGLAGRCAVEVIDYRDLPMHALSQRFDKIVSVGMFEHVGCMNLRTYFHTVYSLLRPGGLFLNHGIITAPERRPNHLLQRLLKSFAQRLWRDGEFIERYVFPGGELVTLAEAIRVAEEAGFETRDVESLREHYVRTLRHWVRRLEAKERQAVRLVGGQTYRTWRLYMAASAHAFARGHIGVAQILLAKPTAEGQVHLPRTRADICRPASPGRIDGGAHS